MTRAFVQEISWKVKLLWLTAIIPISASLKTKLDILVMIIYNWIAYIFSRVFRLKFLGSAFVTRVAVFFRKPEE